MSTIDELTAKVKRLEEQLRTAQISLCSALVDAHPVKVGDVTRDRAGEEFRVTYVMAYDWGRVEMRGNPRKKNGEWSKADRNIYA